MRFGAVPTGLLERFAFMAGKVPVPILDTLIGPLQSKALIAAEQVGALSALAEQPVSTAELARRLSVDAECLGLVLRVLRAMGYVDLDGEQFSLSKLGRRHFGAQAPEPYHAFLGYGDPQWRMVEHLEEVLRTGKGIDFHATHTSTEWAAYQKAMFENASAFAWFVADNLPVPAGATSCLDVAGSHGLVGARLCERNPGLHSTVLDLPEALKTARPLAEARGYAKNVTFREGNLVTDEFGSGHDVILLCNILHHFPEETILAILNKSLAALKPGGIVGIFDIEAPEPAAPPEAAGDAFALFFRITSTSACFRGRDYQNWLGKVGFRRPRTVRSVKMPSRMLVIGEK